MSVTFDRETQRNEAMARANEVRAAVAAFKREIAPLTMAEGCAKVAEFLDDPREPLDAIRAFPLLASIKRIRDSKAYSLLDAAGIRNADKRVRDLTPRQRYTLAAHLRMKAAVQ